jgi:hypothetical protein
MANGTTRTMQAKGTYPELGKKKTAVKIVKK